MADARLIPPPYVFNVSTRTSRVLSTNGHKAAFAFYVPAAVTVAKVRTAWRNIDSSGGAGVYGLAIQGLGADGVPTGSLSDANATATLTLSGSTYFRVSDFAAAFTLNPGWHALIVTANTVSATSKGDILVAAANATETFPYNLFDTGSGWQKETAAGHNGAIDLLDASDALVVRTMGPFAVDNQGSRGTTVEEGNLWTQPFTATYDAIDVAFLLSALTANLDLMVRVGGSIQRTVAVDPDRLQLATGTLRRCRFPIAPITLAAGSSVEAGGLVTGTGTMTLNRLNYASSAMRAARTALQAYTRTSGGAAVAAPNDVCSIALIVADVAAGGAFSPFAPSVVR